MKVTRTIQTVALVGMMLAVCGCATAPKTEAQKDVLRAEADAAMKRMLADDPGLRDFLDGAYGYAIFPEVGKGGLLVGGSYGRGVVYEQGRFAGYADITQATIGLQAGGQAFSELIAFETKEAMDRFKYGKMKLAANASAVALKAGASGSAKYDDGVAIFTKPRGGLMLEAAIGGQEFGFVPAGGQAATRPAQ
jgi:lipid-binding SYLF domain-containing protein